MPSQNSVVTVSRRRAASDSKADDKDKESAAYLKRREQVRRAQRTHRERKENYIKALEDELFQLRAKEREIIRENEALSTEVAQLRSLVNVDGSPTWFGNCSLNGGDAWLDADIDFSLISGNASRIDSCVAWHDQSMDFGDCSKSATSSELSKMYNIPTDPSITGRSTISRCTSTQTVNEVDRTGLAIEFVMTLEKPCLNRATSAILDIGQPTFDLSLSIPRANTYHSFLENSFLNTDVGAQVSSNASLDKLLALSSTFSLKSEVTPIQAWQQIICHPRFSSIGVETLKRLVEEMLWHVKCYGFGAVIDTSIFEMLFNNVLVVA